MIIDGFARQVPDIDPEETAEWIEALDDIIDRSPARAAFLMHRILGHAGVERVDELAERRFATDLVVERR